MYNRVFGVFVLTVMLAGASASADTFSIDTDSPTAAGAGVLDANDVLNDGPQLHVGADTLGVPGFDLDALSSGLDSVDGSDVMYFSVDRNGQGASDGFIPSGNDTADTMNVPGQAGLNQQASDVFFTVDSSRTGSSPVGWHNQAMDDQSFGLVPDNYFFTDDNIGGNQDNLNAYSHEEFDVFGNDRVPDRPVFYSIVSSTGGGADILVHDPNTGDSSVFAAAEELGLDSNDDIDGLALNLAYDFDAGDIVGGALYFSLAPDSPSLGGVDSPADVFMATFAYPGEVVLDDGPAVWYTAESLGLLENDNVDALETNAYIPEPTTMALLGLGGLALLRRRRTA